MTEVAWRLQAASHYLSQYWPRLYVTSRSRFNLLAITSLTYVANHIQSVKVKNKNTVNILEIQHPVYITTCGAPVSPFTTFTNI